MSLNFPGTEITQSAAEYLNDPSRQAYTDELLFPCLKSAYQTIKDDLVKNSSETIKEVVEPLDVTAGSQGFDVPPPDLIYPIQLMERPKGSTNSYTPMSERAWEANKKPGAFLGGWTWREDAIKFLGATSDVEVMLRYLKDMVDLTSVADTIYIAGAISYLSWRVAAIAAATIGEDYDRAKYLEAEAEKAKYTFLGTSAKSKQGLPGRRKRYRAVGGFRRFQ